MSACQPAVFRVARTQENGKNWRNRLFQLQKLVILQSLYTFFVAVPLNKHLYLWAKMGCISCLLIWSCNSQYWYWFYIINCLKFGKWELLILEISINFCAYCKGLIIHYLWMEWGVTCWCLIAKESKQGVKML